MGCLNKNIYIYIIITEPETELQHNCIIVLDPSGYFLMLIGATIGYYLMGYYLTAACMRRNQRNNNNIIIAETL